MGFYVPKCRAKKSWQFVPKEGGALSDEVAQNRGGVSAFFCQFFRTVSHSIRYSLYTVCARSVFCVLLHSVCVVIFSYQCGHLIIGTLRALAQVAGALEKSARVIDVGDKY